MKTSLAGLTVVAALLASSHAFGWGAVQGRYGGAAYRGPYGGAAVRTPSGAAAVRYPGRRHRVPATNCLRRHILSATGIWLSSPGGLSDWRRRWCGGRGWCGSRRRRRCGRSERVSAATSSVLCATANRRGAIAPIWRRTMRLRSSAALLGGNHRSRAIIICRVARRLMFSGD